MAKTPRGHIRKRGNRHEVAIRQGRDPITRRYRYVYESAKTYEEAERQRDKLLERVAEGREADTKATVSLLLDRWLAVADLAVSTRHVVRLGRDPAGRFELTISLFRALAACWWARLMVASTLTPSG